MKTLMISVPALIGLAVPAFGDTAPTDSATTGQNPQVEERPGEPSSDAIPKKTPRPMPTKNVNDTGGIGLDGGNR